MTRPVEDIEVRLAFDPAATLVDNGAVQLSAELQITLSGKDTQAIVRDVTTNVSQETLTAVFGDSLADGLAFLFGIQALEEHPARRDS